MMEWLPFLPILALKTFDEPNLSPNEIRNVNILPLKTSPCRFMDINFQSLKLCSYKAKIHPIFSQS